MGVTARIQKIVIEYNLSLQISEESCKINKLEELVGTLLLPMFMLS